MITDQRSSSGLVERYIGTAYDVVKSVADNMDNIQFIVDNINDINNSLPAIQAVVDELVKVEAVADNMSTLLAIEAALTEIDTVFQSINSVDSVANNIAAIQSIANNINIISNTGALTIAFDALDGRIEANELKLADIENNAKDDQTGAEIKTLYEAEANTNAFTDAEKSKLAALDSSRFKGLFTSVGALNLNHPTALPGDYANVDAGVGENVRRYIWDDSDAAWIQQVGSAAALTDAEIKTGYENNPDTNAFTDALKAKLEALVSSHYRGLFPTLITLEFNTSPPQSAALPVAGDYADVDLGVGQDIQRYIWDVDDAQWIEQVSSGGGGSTAFTAAEIKTLYESNLDTNALTDVDLQVLDNLRTLYPNTEPPVWDLPLVASYSRSFNDPVVGNGVIETYVHVFNPARAGTYSITGSFNFSTDFFLNGTASIQVVLESIEGIELIDVLNISNAVSGTFNINEMVDIHKSLNTSANPPEPRFLKILTSAGGQSNSNLSLTNIDIDITAQTYYPENFINVVTTAFEDVQTSPVTTSSTSQILAYTHTEADLPAGTYLIDLTWGSSSSNTGTSVVVTPEILINGVPEILVHHTQREETKDVNNEFVSSISITKVLNLDDDIQVNLQLNRVGTNSSVELSGANLSIIKVA